MQSPAVSDVRLVVSSSDGLQLICKGEMNDFPKYAEGTRIHNGPQPNVISVISVNVKGWRPW